LIVFELVLVMALVGGLIGLPLVVSVAPWEIVFGAGAGLIALGMLVGVPAGAYYHWLLYRALGPRAELGAGWWWRPTLRHGALAASDRRRVLRWFYVGAAGFLIAMVGCALFAIGAVRSL
jgi:hypothetical protein